MFLRMDKMKSRIDAAKKKDAESEQAQCTGKKPFDTYKQAERAKNSNQRTSCAMVYRCDYCHKWHFGRSASSSKPGKRPKYVVEDEL